MKLSASGLGRLAQRCLAWAADNKGFTAVSFAGLVIYLLVSILRHIHFQTSGFDLVIFDQAVRFYSQFEAPASSFRGYANLLGDHFHPILALLAPLYWFSDSAINLLVAQAVLISSASLPIYLFAKAKLGKTAAILLVVTYLLNAALLQAVQFDFHEVAFAVPLIAWAILLIERQSWAWFYVVITLLLLVKEDLSLLVAFFGLYLFILRYYKHGIVLVAAGVAWFMTVTNLLIPYFAGTGRSFNYWGYDQLGPDLPSAIKTVVTQPLHALSIFVTPAIKVMTMIKTFGATLGLSFLSPIIILAVPLALERFLSSNQNHWQFYYHYGATTVPILIMAATDGIQRLTRLKPWRKKAFTRYFTVGGSALLAAMTIGFFIASPMTYIFQPERYTLSADEKAGYRLMSQIPASGSVCTTNHIAPHLGSHQLKLIGYDDPNPRLECDYIIIARYFDQSASINPTIERSIAEGFDLTVRDGPWELYQRLRDVPLKP